MIFNVGDRVQIKSDTWVREFTGMIATFPKGEFFEKEFRNGVKIAGDCCRVHENVDTKEEIRTYWVEFDSEQQDVEGDGPYQAGEIHEEDLECVDKIAVQ